MSTRFDITAPPWASSAPAQLHLEASPNSRIHPQAKCHAIPETIRNVLSGVKRGAGSGSEHSPIATVDSFPVDHGMDGYELPRLARLLPDQGRARRASAVVG